MRKKTPEGYVLNAIQEYLAVRKIWFRRMNSGTAIATHAGKTRAIRYGSPGMADILATPMIRGELQILWIEAKAGSKQSEAQKAFQCEVEAQGHGYVVARSINDVEVVLENL